MAVEALQEGDADQASKQAAWHLWQVVLFGQLLSAVLAMCGITSTALASRGVSLPATQSTLVYLLTGLVYGSLAAWRHRRDNTSWTSHWPKCAGLALLDVEATFLVVTAYRFTSLTSVTLLDCTTIPEVLLLTWLILGTRYRLGHWGGAALALLGSALLVLSDSQGGGAGDGTRPVLGDALVLLGALLYAVVNITEEHLLGVVSRVELLALVGTSAALFCGAQAALLEHQGWAAIPFTWQVLGLFAGYGGALFAFTSLVPLMLMHGGSAALNLSLLTSDFWAAGARALFFGGFGQRSGAAFAAAFLLVAAGLTVFSLSGEVQRQGSPYSRLQEQLAVLPVPVSAGASSEPERQRLRSCDLEAGSSKP